MNYTQNEKIEQVTDSTMVVGVDIGSQIHYARAFDNRGRELTKRIFSFHNDLEGFNSFNLWAETLKTENKKTAVLIGYLTSDSNCQRCAVSDGDQTGRKRGAGHRGRNPHAAYRGK